MFIDPNQIVVEARQRTRLDDIDSMAEIIKTHGQIQPIVVRRSPDSDRPILVVGQRRMEGCKKLGIEVEALFKEDLSADQALEIELEENVKRSDLKWRDHVAAVAAIHNRRREKEPTWNSTKTGERLGLKAREVRNILLIHKNITSDALKEASSIKHALGILQVIADRRAANLVNEITKTAQDAFTKSTQKGNSNDGADTLALPPGPVPDGASKNNNTVVCFSNPATSDHIKSDDPIDSEHNLPVSIDTDGNVSNPQQSIINTNFETWATTYEGEKFNFLHCDFPYGIKYDSYAASTGSTQDDYDTRTYWKLLDVLETNLDRILSYQSHVMFWFSMEFYTETKQRLEKMGFFVHAHPLIWLKSDNAGIIPGRENKYPRRIYETAFLCSRGNRTLVKQVSNAYAAPTTSHPIHPSQKPEPVLNHFFQLFIDETTDVLDPTCGSGAAIRSALTRGARTAIGIELNQTYAEAAVIETDKFLLKRSLSV